MNLKIAIVVNHIFPFLKSGDVLAAFNEIQFLKKNGIKVIILSEIDSNFETINEINYLSDGTEIITRQEKVKSKYLDAIICHQPSGIQQSLELKKRFNCPIICRHHIDLEILGNLSDRLNCPSTEMFDRNSPSKSLKQYKQFINSADLLLDVDPMRFKTKRRSEFFPPIFSMTLPKLLASDRRIENKVLICGRLNDPMKGGNRILSFAKLACKHSIVVNIVGILSDSQKNELSKLKNVVIYNWTNSRAKLFSLMQQSSFFISLSHYEPFGLASAESVSNGCCLIGSHEGFAALCNVNTNYKTSVNNTLQSSEFIFQIVEIILNLSSNKSLYKKIRFHQNSVLRKLVHKSNNYTNLIDEKVTRYWSKLK